MTPYPPQWLEVVRRPRARAWTLPYGADEPLVPWIAPPVPPRLEEIVMREGIRREFEPGEYIYPAGMPLNILTVITEGVAGRTFGSLYNQQKQGMALAIPHRVCAGNHTFFSERPGNGRYFAVSPVKAVSLPNRRIKELMREDLELRELVEVQCECCIQSDRMGLGSIAVLPVMERLKLYFISWGLAYGRLVHEDGTEWLRYPAILPQTQIMRVIVVSLSQIRRAFAELREDGSLVTEGAALILQARALDDTWRWMRNNEEPICAKPRPEDWRELLT
ncbi:hypothetical protein [Sutterella sp.]|uniref:hypothetical protein n=1 Tax=Sutterella sp. TaxID=1981025 RepID=UPI0026E0C6D9|nr:hypothetical protein [Sutterella sp.]MDO5530739.1 hypothetical protein [Sutterella sp.]